MKTHAAYLQELLGESFPIQSLELGDLQRYVEQRSKYKGMHGRRVSAATIKKDIVTLRAIWNWSLGMGIVKKPFPSRGLRLPKSEEKPPFQTHEEIERRIRRGGLAKAEVADLWERAYLTLDEIAALLDHVKRAADEPFIYPLFVFAAHTGARRSEVLRSRIDDIDFDSQTTLIREKKRVRGKLSTRRVPLSSLLTSVLHEWFRQHPGGNYTLCHTQSRTRIESQSCVKPLNADESHNDFKSTLRGTIWERLRGWHVLRHSFCSNCAARGIDQRVINAWVGHQSEEMVRRYRHLLPSQSRESIELVFGKS